LLYDLRIPKINPHMSGALIECIYAVSGTPMRAGDKILDLSIDLGQAFAQECPPISYYRLVLRENLWLRRLEVTAGVSWDTARPLAIFSSDPDEPTDATPGRTVRSAVAGIVYHTGMWSGNAP
jgi:hypothetical protein